ncbi:MAG: site-2 protease family protein [Gemmatimonadetes bacterium]|nr:site-2 protease family protein [Gemmatimonadota bacterium]
MPLRQISRFLSYWRVCTALDREVVDAVLAPAYSSSTPELLEALKAWPGTYYWSRREGSDRLVLIRALAPAPADRWALHLLLFLATFATVWIAGTFLTDSPLRFGFPVGPDLAVWWGSVKEWIGASMPGLGFATALMSILLAHEMGHYMVAKWYRISASLPYFLPAPPQLNFIGTFGAFIRLRSPIVDRRQLIDVGAAGPWAGLVVALVVLVIGLLNSQVIAGVEGETRQLIYIAQRPFYLGDSLLMSAAISWLVGEGTVQLHPMALAGWFGLFVTTLNLLPLGQLDGGHIVYALVGRHQATIGKLMWYGLVILGFQFWGWWLWAALILILGRGRLAHPSVLEPHRPIPRSRWPLGVATAVLFIVTFTIDPLPSIL